MVADIYFKIVRPKDNFSTDIRTGSDHHQWMSCILKSPNDPNQINSLFKC